MKNLKLAAAANKTMTTIAMTMPTRHCAKDLPRFRSKKVTIQPDYMGSIYGPQQSYQRWRLFLSTNHTPSKSGISKGNTQINSHMEAKFHRPQEYPMLILT